MMRTRTTVLVALLCWPALAEGAPKKGAAPAKVSTKVTVAGPVALELATIDAEITVKAGPAKSVSVTVESAEVKSVGLVKRGKNGIAVTFDGDDRLEKGAVTVTVPAGSDADLTTVSGEVQVAGTGGDVRVKAVSGEVKVEKADDVNVTTVSGEIELRAVSGEVRARTVSGDASVQTTGRADAKLEFETTSGELDWSGRCGKGCAIEAKSLSGEIGLALDPASSFDLEFTSFSGDLDDSLGLSVKRSQTNRHGGGTVTAKYRGGGGSVEVETFSGELSLKKK